MRYLILILIMIPGIAKAETKENIILNIIDAAADAELIPRQVLRSLAFVESSLNPSPPLKLDGNSYSYGLFQIKLKTARHMGFRGKVSELKKPSINASIAAKYLRYQLKRYKGNWIKALSAYNAGHCGVDNLEYVNRVLSRVVNLL